MCLVSIFALLLTPCVASSVSTLCAMQSAYPTKVNFVLFLFVVNRSDCIWYICPVCCAIFSSTSVVKLVFEQGENSSSGGL